MKKFIFTLAIVSVLSFSLAFSPSDDEKKSDSKTKCPFLQQQTKSDCPYSGKSPDGNLNNGYDAQCPFLNENKSENKSCPYLDGMKSNNSENKSIKQVWKEIKS